MIRKLLIANRGEIAVRIIRACREMGIEAVAVYSEADKESLHTQLADEAICIGPGPSAGSYLNMESIISAAMISGADAIHPGFGFLSENARFAQICEQCGITFVGPPSQVIQNLGNKQIARNTMMAAGVPVIPGTEEAILDAKTGAEKAAQIGYPVIIKAALGGGGKGMRTAFSPEEFELAFLTAQKESQIAFGDGTMYIEHFVEHPRHIEFQILADSQGNVVHLGERDCSIQRNHQKMIEESPSMAVSEELRKEMGIAAVKAAKAAHYVNAGTIEFLLEKTGKFYFMEMNTRIQVEHPVTEWVTGLDLVKEQLKIASGEPLSFSQKDIHIQGHAIECRINAENPWKNFRPSPGTITDLHLPGGQGIRVDTGIYSGYQIPPYYDSMLAKLIVHGDNRQEAIAKMKSALGEVIIQGVDTNVDYQFEIMNDSDYQKGEFDIGFLESHQIGGVKVNEA
ncbi:acetyl-CoA carboxylase biotin carboxylase subunit [Blautia glucerasea]|uniref:acetyl-CoA carboxylase biotin carboxylase subunit n=1 Tax=Blautia glucerasea TaxID=536633 RepID=UPI001D02D565|nr:acetyl-CoA carboxylase biotin carboxylase subunit [Blautia glucerasea]MCB5386570.1 acetyl-CoA carboxylase biotin carboxylase subunit [Blautia glucerasea]MCB5420925.1 acetyl-CoA carboxylase biotin carboxylase subunit [Blautia luti]